MGSAGAGGADGGRLSPQADVLLTLRRLCQQYRALPSQVLAEDGGLLLQLLEVDHIIQEAGDEYAREQRGEAGAADPLDLADLIESDEREREASGSG